MILGGSTIKDEPCIESMMGDSSGTNVFDVEGASHFDQMDADNRDTKFD